MELESKFIEGTNEQYSIRNDGAVIIHYKRGNVAGTRQPCERIIHPKGYISKKFPNKAIQPTVVIKGKLLCLRPLVLKYFPIKKPEGTSKQMGYKDNNPFNCSIDNLYYLELKSKEHKSRITKKRNNSHKEEVSKSYISSKMGIKVENLDEKFYQAVKKRILIKRKIKQLQNGKERTYS